MGLFRKEESAAFAPQLAFPAEGRGGTDLPDPTSFSPKPSEDTDSYR